MSPMPSPRQLTMILSATLSALVVLSAASPIPVVPISSVQDLDEGAEVKVLGVVADMRRFDSGTEAIVLVDLGDGSSITVYCVEGLGTPPGYYANIGDELSAAGKVVRSGGRASLLSSAGQMALSRAAEYVLTASLLSENWESFLGDEITIRGEIIQDQDTGGVRLRDQSSEVSIALQSDSTEIRFYADFSVVLAGKLLMDQQTLSLLISVDWIRPQQ